MGPTLPIRKYVKVWIKRRKNNPRDNGSQTVSYTLEWLEFGQRRFLSLGKHATLAYARQAAAQKERELNSADHADSLDPILWASFVTKYLDTLYPGHELATAERKEMAKKWSKSFKTMKRESQAMESFKRLLKPEWCHEITGEDREKFITKRLPEVGSPASVDVELRALRMLCNIMEEWKHRPETAIHSLEEARRPSAICGNEPKNSSRQPCPNTTPSIKLPPF